MAEEKRRGPKKMKATEKKVQVYYMVKSKHQRACKADVDILIKTKYECA
jgi:hypothetical protein